MRFSSPSSRRNLQDKIGNDVSLHTVEYLEGNAMQGRLIPRLVGFLSPIEREFFDMFCEVDGVGVKKRSARWSAPSRMSPR